MKKNGAHDGHDGTSNDDDDVDDEPTIRGRTRIRTVMVPATSIRLMTARMTTVIT